ncbi:MAG: bifunctional phosphoribosylaminoimidazolecarboxamide formyltransferase/IMP cyclohydrolase [Candidatus Thermoplasmatota archaeon]|nr:bifunctional phosphoribosylaminoimidazolecarboxamide formyltransferase/IMP cyclohydrolase [Candidatus Thermoplasmatota archaeon]
MTIKRALISVSDKEGLIDFATAISKLNIALISTGGTAVALRKAKLAPIEVSTLTGFPEMLEGRVKTLHPVVHAGILAKRKEKQHMNALKTQHIDTIDMVVCNLYPFEQTIKKPKVSIEEVVENIDIGGPTLIRAAAKNYHDVIVVTSQKQYNEVMQKLQTKGNLTIGDREKLAVEAYSHTAQYDTIISTYLQKKWIAETLPNNLSATMRKIQNMRYGENPHQHGAFYQALPATTEPCIATAVQLQGKELSFNNILDSDCAIECTKEFSDPSCVIIKHATPCGIASASTLLQAWKDAFATDVQSPFGGIVSFNREVDKDVAKELSKYFLEVVIAPGFSKEAASIFGKKKNLRLLVVHGLDKPIDRNGIVLRSVIGGFLAQDRDIWLNDRKNWKIVTSKKPTKDELSTMAFAVKCVKHVKSNSVLFAKGTRTVAIGGGQTSRVDAAWIATHKGQENIKESVMASDAFFPFRDAVDVAAKAGVTAIIQPGGSIRDDEVINAANKHRITMVFSGQRYFRH